ncbi:MAG: diacylglycerol kinase family protein [Acidobacteriota bacterium]
MSLPLVIANPHAGPRWRRARIARSLAEAAAAGRLELIQTQTLDQGRQTVRRAANEGRRVVVVGGDGTLQSAVSGFVLAAADAPPEARLALVPAGRGNDLARSLGIPRGFGPALRLALEGQTSRRLDAGLANVDGVQTVFANALGIGFDAAVAVRAKRVPLSGFAAYLVAALATLAGEPGPWPLLASIDGVDQTASFSLLSLGNGSTTGGGFRLTPDADPTDGRLDFCAAVGARRLELLGLLPLALLGRHRNHARITLGRCETVVVEARQGVPVHADGEVLSPDARRIEVSLLAGALSIVTAE